MRKFLENLILAWIAILGTILVGCVCVFTVLGFLNVINNIL